MPRSLRAGFFDDEDNPVAALALYRKGAKASEDIDKAAAENVYHSN
jgi:hypothetical protein